MYSITELRCTTCNGSLELPQSSDNVLQIMCEYCGAILVLSKEIDEKTSQVVTKPVAVNMSTEYAVEKQNKDTRTSIEVAADCLRELYG